MKRIHFIAIGGAAMHNLAIALHQKGYRVSGSDDAIYEPSYSRLSANGLLPETMGWDTTRITDDLDVVILGMHARVDNPELVKAQAMGLKIYSYPEYIYEQSKDKLRVVIGGSHGKTTITSMILHVLKHFNKDFDYLVGAQLKGFDTMVKLSDSAPIVVIEGDEYLASPIDRRPKFHLYKANIAVISGVAWDHINVFPTFNDYKSQFAQFIQTITTGGQLFYCADDNVLVDIVAQTKADIHQQGYTMPQHLVKDGQTYLLPGEIPLQIFGQHNLLNLHAARLVCEQLGITPHDFNLAISSFAGAAKRLELVGKVNQTNIYKDFAHSPSKLKATISAVKNQYPTRRLVAMMELHTFSSLNKDFLKEYYGAMQEADLAVVYIDAKTLEQKKMAPLAKELVVEAFGRADLHYFTEPKKLYDFLTSINYWNCNLLLMSSGTYAGLDLANLSSQLKTDEQ